MRVAISLRSCHRVIDFFCYGESTFKDVSLICYYEIEVIVSDFRIYEKKERTHTGKSRDAGPGTGPGFCA